MENLQTPPSLPDISSVPATPSSRPQSSWSVRLSTGLGVGYLPIMPGTYGSAEGVLLFMAIAWLLRGTPNGVWMLCAAMLLLAAISWWIIARALPHFSSDDPSAIVIDEVAGQGLTLLGITLARSDLSWSWLGLAVGFFLFRAFDALKPYPIWKLGNWKGALGVLADDIGAAIAAGALLYGVGRLGWI